MAELKYKFTNDVLFRILFTTNTDLLKKLVADLLVIPFDSITEFVITNPDVPPDVIGEKYCRLDINMIVNGQRTNLKV